MFDTSSLRYHPTRMRWLYEQSAYAQVVRRWEQAPEMTRTMLGSAHFAGLGLDDEALDQLEGLEDQFCVWRDSPNPLLIDLANVIDLVPELDEGDERFIPDAERFEEGAYVHFGRLINGYEGFYATFDKGDGELRYVLVTGGSCDPGQTAQAAALGFADTFDGAITQGHDTVDGQGQDRSISDEIRRRGVAGVRHMLATISFINTHLEAFVPVVPADAPPLLARQARLVTGENRTAFDMLWSRGWFEVEVMQIPGDAHSLPVLDMPDPSEDHEARDAEFARFARHVISTHRGFAQQGISDHRADLGLAILLERAFQAGADSRDRGSPVLTLDRRNDYGEAAWRLGIAAYGKSPGAPVLDAAYRRGTDERWPSMRSAPGRSAFVKHFAPSSRRRRTALPRQR